MTSLWRTLKSRLACKERMTCLALSLGRLPHGLTNCLLIWWINRVNRQRLIERKGQDMSQLSIVGVAGSPTSTSSTRRLIVETVERVAKQTGATPTIIDVADTGALKTLSRAEGDPKLESALRAVETADLLVVGSPVYKGSYTGIFKHFIDFVDYRALIGTPVALLATGGSDRHALVIEHQLRPLFAFFQAHVLGTGLFLTSNEFVDGKIVGDLCQQRFDRMISEAVAALESRRSMARQPVGVAA